MRHRITAVAVLLLAGIATAQQPKPETPVSADPRLVVEHLRDEEMVALVPSAQAGFARGPVSLKTVAFGPPSKKSINHLMLEVENIDDVFMTHDLVQASNYPVMISLGKHANDHMFSFYAASPSGFLIEVGWGGRPATHQSEYYTRDTYGHVFSRAMGPGMSIDK